MATSNVKYVVNIPLANSFRFTRDGVVMDQRANIDQIRFSKAKHATQDRRVYYQLWENADPARVQYMTNFPLMKLEVFNVEETIIDNPAPLLAREYRSQHYRAQCKFFSKNGKLFVYFYEGVEYTDEAMTLEGDEVKHLGRLPITYAKVGDIVRYRIGDTSEDILSAPILSIEYIPELSAEGYLIDVDYNLLDPVDGSADVKYNQKDYAVYYHDLDFSELAEGLYFIKISFGISSFTGGPVFISEPIHVKQRHENTLALKYRHSGEFDADDRFGYLYLFQWENIFRVPATLHKLNPSGEITVYNDDYGVPTETQRTALREYVFNALNIPTWAADKFNVIFAHDTKEINEYQWSNENYGSISYISDTDLCSFEINLRQRGDRTLAMMEFESTVSFELSPDSDIIPFGGGTIEVVVTTNSGGVFKWSNLPAWITSDMAEFEDGDTVILTIAANATLFERSVNLSAYSDDFPGLTDSISIEQEYDTSTPVEFLEVNPNFLSFIAEGELKAVLVNASGPFTLLTLPGATMVFEALFSVDYDQVTVEAEPSTDSFQRNATLRITLTSNPAIYVDISLTQEENQAVQSIAVEGPNVIGWEPETYDYTVIAPAGLAHNIRSNTPWISVTSNVRLGTVVRQVHVSKNQGTSTRIGSITVYSTVDPTNSDTLFITQGGI